MHDAQLLTDFSSDFDFSRHLDTPDPFNYNFYCCRYKYACFPTVSIILGPGPLINRLKSFGRKEGFSLSFNEVF